MLVCLCMDFIYLLTVARALWSEYGPTGLGESPSILLKKK